MTTPDAAGACAPGWPAEAALAERWASGVRGPLRLADGRTLHVIFPGVPGGASGPDFRGAALDAGGDLLRGDVEVHLLASGWETHGHGHDPAYAQVVLHVVGINDRDRLVTTFAERRAIPLLVLAPDRAQATFPPPFVPPCALAAARKEGPAPALERLGLRRLRMKAARVAPLVADAGPGQALYALLLETLGGAANRAAFAALARQRPLAALLERAATYPRCGPASTSRQAIFSAELRGAAAMLVLRRAGSRPLAAPGRRLDVAGSLIAALWPLGAAPCWPATSYTLPDVPRTGGLGRSAWIELQVNAVLPVALAAGAVPEGDIIAAWNALPSPGTYGKLRRLAAWLETPLAKPFPSAGRLQGGLLLHAEYCTKGQCGRCPVSGER